MKKKQRYNKVGKSQEDYYSRLFKEKSYSPEAVGSANLTNKKIRYTKLSQVFINDNNFTVHDVGHGLGYYYEFLKENFPEKNIKYSGSEVCQRFVDFCKKNYPECSFHYRNLSIAPFKEKYDYLIFGGTFYHIEDNDTDEWKSFIESNLLNAFKSCNKGISFNFVTEFCDYFDKGLFYCELDYIIKFITQNLSRFFSIDHSYPLYEFTVCVYKESHIKKLYPEDELKKYFRSEGKS